MACWRAIADADTFVCLSEKQIMPAIIIRNALTAVRKVPEPKFNPETDPPRLLAPLAIVVIPPRLKINSSAPKIRPLTPASESIRLVASVKQWIAPSEQIRLTTSTTIEVAERLVGRLGG